jgi:hypothetical protein
MSLEDDERRRLAEAVRRVLLDAAEEAYQQAGYGGLCAEGRWELALDALRTVPLDGLVAEPRGRE